MLAGPCSSLFALAESRSNIVLCYTARAPSNGEYSAPNYGADVKVCNFECLWELTPSMQVVAAILTLQQLTVVESLPISRGLRLQIGLQALTSDAVQDLGSVVGDVWTGLAEAGRDRIASFPRGAYQYQRAALFCLGAVVAFVLAAVVRKVLILLTFRAGNVNPSQHNPQGQESRSREQRPGPGQPDTNQEVRSNELVSTCTAF